MGPNYPGELPASVKKRMISFSGQNMILLILNGRGLEPVRHGFPQDSARAIRVNWRSSPWRSAS